VGTFRASTDGFAFTNAWPRQPALRLATPFGRLPLGNAANGLCGGMVFAALDFWHAGVAAPTQRPGPDDPLYAFIVRRLVDSWHIPAGVLQYFQWMTLPDTDRVVTVLGRDIASERGLSWRTLEVEWPQVRASLDAGTPVPLGLVTVASANPKDLARNHQVLAWSYSVAGGRDGRVTVGVYDPNSGRRDDVTIAFELGNPAGPTAFDHTIDIAHPVRGFFATAYDPSTPPA
jgi:hypothetical protein